MKLEPLPEPQKAAPIQDDGQLSAEMSLVEREAIEAGLGPLTYLPEKDAWDCTCPHESMHGNKPNDKDTILYRRSRYIKCAHQSCKRRLKIFNKGFRETIREAERDQEPEIAWTDALKMAVVTSSQLHALKLTPRKKLLGDWLAEGDPGFIFAFRGTGKTWLATAMANVQQTNACVCDLPMKTRILRCNKGCNREGQKNSLRCSAPTFSLQPVAGFVADAVAQERLTLFQI